MNIKLRLAEEGELEEGAATGHTLEFVLEKEEVVLLKEKEDAEEHKGERQSQQQQQFCSEAAQNDRTEPCSAKSSQSPNSNNGPDSNP